MSNFKLIVFNLLVLILKFNFVIAGTGLPCSLSWQTSGFGRILKLSVNAGVKNFVSRIAVVQIPNLPVFYGGYLDIRTGISYAADSAEQVHTSQTYSVLTNPLNCSLAWISHESNVDVIPPTAVLVDENLPPQDSYYIGRAQFEGTWKSGTTIPGFSYLFSAKSEDEKVLKFRNYEILTSELPSLRVYLSKFNFQTINLIEIERLSKPELFSVDHIYVVESDNIYFNLETEGVIDEYYEFTESLAESWVGVSTIDVNFVPWFGSPALKQTLKVTNKAFAAEFGVRFDRERHLRISANFSVIIGYKSVGCSYAIILEDYDIPYEAEARYVWDKGQNKISHETIRQILEDAGHDITGFVDLSDGSVKGKILGTVTGRFVLRTYLLAEQLMDPAYFAYGPCDKHLIIP